MVAPLTVHAGWTIGPGWTIVSGNTSPPGPSGSNGVVGFSEMTATGNIVNWIEAGASGNATITTNGFIQTANVGSPGIYNGVAISSLTANNQAFFSTYGTGYKTVTWASGSTFTTPMTVNLAGNDQTGAPGLIVFYMNDVPSFPATFIFPITFT